MSINENSTVAGFLNGNVIDLIFKGLIALAVPFAIWTGSIVAATHDAVIQLQTQMSERTADRYTSHDAARDLAEVHAAIERNRADINSNSARLVTDEQFIFNRPARSH